MGMMKAGAQAFTAVHGTKFKDAVGKSLVGPVATTIYEASGGVTDHAYDEFGIVYSYVRKNQPWWKL